MYFVILHQLIFSTIWFRWTRVRWS